MPHHYPNRTIIGLLTAVILFACSPYFMRPVDDLYRTIGEHFGGLVVTGNYQEFCLLLTEEITNEHLPWWNPLATCTETLLADAFDAALDDLTPGGVPDLAAGYDDNDGLDEYFQMLAAEYGLNITGIQPITPGLSLYDRVDLPASPFYWADETITDQYQVFAFDGPTENHLWGAYCLDFTEVGSRTVIADIRLGCCYDGFTVCSREACDRCPGGPPPADYCDSPGPLQQEAEAAELHGAFEIFGDSEAGGGQAIRVSADVGGGTDTDHYTDFCFEVADEGDYHLVGQFLAANNDEDSFYVTVNGLPTAGYLWDMPAGPTWQTDTVTDRNNDNAVVIIRLMTGSNLVRVYHRERYTGLDWLRLERQ